MSDRALVDKGVFCESRKGLAEPALLPALGKEVLCTHSCPALQRVQTRLSHSGLLQASQEYPAFCIQAGPSSVFLMPIGPRSFTAWAVFEWFPGGNFNDSVEVVG